MNKHDDLENLTEGLQMPSRRLRSFSPLESEALERLREVLSIGREWLAHLLFGVQWQDRHLGAHRPVFWLASRTEQDHVFDSPRVDRISSAGPSLGAVRVE